MCGRRGSGIERFGGGSDIMAILWRVITSPRLVKHCLDIMFPFPSCHFSTSRTSSTLRTLRSPYQILLVSTSSIRSGGRVIIQGVNYGI